MNCTHSGKIFLLVALFVAQSGWLCAQQPDLSKDENRPNIVWIVAEDMSPHLSSFGDTELSTPNLDALAKDGIRFTNTYMVAGVCAPSRAGIITGMYPTAVGANNMRTTSAAPGNMPAHVPPPYSVVFPSYVKGFPEYLRGAGYYCTNNAKEDYQFQSPVTLWDESSRNGHWRNREKNQPFFAVFNLGITHESQLWEREKEPLLVDPAKVKLPPYYPDVAEARQAIARNLTNIIKMDQQAGAILKQLKEDGLYDNSIIFFYTDHGDGLPYVKREVLKRGLHVPMIIKLPKARGAGSVNTEMISSVDFAATILSLAGVPVPAHLHGRAFMGTQKSKAPRQYVFAGRDRMDTEVDRVRTVLDSSFQYIRNYMPEKPYYQNVQYRLNIPLMKRMLAMRDSGTLNKAAMHWFAAKKLTEELYDLQNDPYQLNNLATVARYRKKLESMRVVYDNWYTTVGDLSVQPELEMIRQKMWNGSDSVPQTAMPELVSTTNGFYINCATAGAGIAYKIVNATRRADSSSNWILYQHQPVKLSNNDQLTVRAQRIGYKPSVLQFDYQLPPKEITYKQLDTVNLKMQLYFPDSYEKGRSYPAIVLFFGGGWNNGTTKQFEPHARYFASRGMIAITADYRVKNRQQTTPYESVKDARSAIRFLREHAAELGIDTTRLAAGGGSAGGHLAAAANLTNLNEATDKLQYNARPNALVLFNPVINNGPGGYGHERFGDAYASISPYHNIRKSAAPTIIFLGTKDKLIPVQQMKDYQQKMQTVGARCEIFFYEDQPHGFFNYKKEGNRYYDATLAEADRFLKSLGYIE